jgi:transcriptional regulator with XRE-family HTH domain
LREDTQAQFAARMQVSVSTLQAMERGEPSVSVGYWASAIWVLDRLEELDRVLAPPDDPEVRFFEEKRLGDRRRARQPRQKRRREGGSER